MWACVFWICQRLMYDFHYHYIENKYGPKAKLLFTDTDSLCYEIETKDIYKELWEDKQLFDNSDYRKDSKFSGRYAHQGIYWSQE